MTEAEISREIDAFLRSIGGSVYSVEQGYRKERGGTRQTPGIPDKIVFFADVWTFAEIKRPKGKLRPSQQQFRDDCERADVPWTLWRDVRDAWDWCVTHGIITEG